MHNIETGIKEALKTIENSIREIQERIQAHLAEHVSNCTKVRSYILPN